MQLLWVFAAITILALIVPGSSNTCQITGDPHLIDYQRKSASVPFPCIYHVANLSVHTNDTSKNTFIEVNVFAASNKIYKGRFYVNYAKVSVKLYKYKGNDRPSMQTSMDFEITGNRAQQFRNHQLGLADMWGARSTPQSLVQFGYDDTEDLVLLTFRDASLEITFRPVNESDGIPQRRTPGLVITVNDDIVQNPDATFPKTLCSNPQDKRSFKDLARSVNVNTPRQLMLYTALNQKGSQLGPLCKQTVQTFKTCNTKSEAVEACTYIMKYKMVHCLQKNAGNVLKAFYLCLKKECGDVGAKNDLAELIYPCF